MVGDIEIPPPPQVKIYIYIPYEILGTSCDEEELTDSMNSFTCKPVQYLNLFPIIHIVEVCGS